MGDQTFPSVVWDLAARQHGCVSRRQLLDAGYSPKAIKHRVATGRLHRVARGVYAVGRPELTMHGRLMAATLACGPLAALSHTTAAVLWDLLRPVGGPIELSVPHGVRRRHAGLVVHRRTALCATDITMRDAIPVTTPVCTLVDVAAVLPPHRLEAAVNEADKRDLVDPEALRDAVGRLGPRPGVAALRALLDRRTFALTDSELERRFLPIARAAGLPRPRTGVRLNGFDVDFSWPDLGLVVETDGLRYHRTPAQQARDRLRDQPHAAAGLTPLRFTHAQVRFDPAHVRSTLQAVVVHRRRAHEQPSAGSGTLADRA